MRRALIIIGWSLLTVVVLVVLVVCGAMSYLWLHFPQVAPAPTLTLTATPQLRGRGAYLYDHVTACGYCHSRRDWSSPVGPITPGTNGEGGEAFTEADGIPGTLYAANITPSGIGTWSDGELWRSLVCGVDRDGTALFPMMPYSRYRQLSVDDLTALIVYVRSLPPIASQVPRRHLLFPMNLIVRTIPSDAAPPATAPAVSDTVATGRYLANAASCGDCHSPMRHGALVPGREFSGGTPFVTAHGTVLSANLTPDPSGIGTWTKASFLARFATGPEVSGAALGFDTPMPWTAYHGMTSTDLGAIYDYLRSLSAVANTVPTVLPAQ